MHWNGTKWRRVSTPNPGGKASGNGQQLTAVSCVSQTNCWAVGSYTDKSSQARLDQALHWNGKTWKLVATPTPAGTGSTDTQQLFGVWCLSGSDCWAVGGAGTLGGSAVNQVLHWDGHKWSLVSVPDPAGSTGTVSNSLHAVACVKATDCWAVGTYRDNSGVERNQALHFNGRKWKLVSLPNPGKQPGMGPPGVLRQLADVACPSATACRAVGSHPNRAAETLNEALRFNGKRWSVTSTPDPGGQSAQRNDLLSGVACTSARACWAVGTFATGNGGTLNQALRWDGKKWSRVFVPEPGGKAASDRNQLEAVACPSSKDCWAVGTETKTTAQGATTSDQILHWNGRKWKAG